MTEEEEEEEEETTVAERKRIREANVNTTKFGFDVRARLDTWRTENPS